MPDNATPDDQFADLFDKLPAPSARSASTDAGAAAAEAPSGAPLSRRAAREAATQDAGGAAANPGARPSAEPSAPSASASASASTPAPAPPLPSPRAETPTPPATAARTAPTIDALFGADERGDDPHQSVQRHERDRRKSRIAGWVVFGIVLALIGGLTAGGFYVWTTYEDRIRAFMGWEEPKDFEAGLATGDAVITIVDGDTGSEVSETLFEAGVTKTSRAFYDYLISTGQNPVFYAGAYSLQLQMTSEAALAALEDPANKLENSAQLREGLTVEQSLTRLADGTGIPLKDFEKAVADPSKYGVGADSLEGWLFPATYTFAPDATATQVIQTLVDRTITALDRAEVPVERRQEILTIASIIEREARYEDDFYKVSRVIQNRLDPSNQETHGLLQMDSTVQYGYGEMHDGTVSTSTEARNDDNGWNTYMHPGLPIGPIANPGDTAIAAAMNPADGPWLYFVTVDLDTGETVFTNTYSEHEKAVTQWRNWCADNPDSGC